MSTIVYKASGGRRTNAGRLRPDAVAMDEVYARIRRAILDGLSDNEAAMYAGCCSKTVWRYRQRHGIPAQTRGGRPPYYSQRQEGGRG